MIPEFVSRDAWLILVSASETNRYIHFVALMMPRHVVILIFTHRGGKCVISLAF